MVWPGVLCKLVLLSLLSSEIAGVEAVVDLNALRRIIDHIENTYKPTAASPPASPRAGATASASAAASACDSVNVFQYAVSIRVHRQFCEANTGEEIPALPDRDAVMKVLNIQDNKQNRVYVDESLVAARPHGDGSTAKHSERMLLIEKLENSKVTPMEHLIGNEHESCVVFYTYNSPCIDHCLNQDKDKDADKKVTVQMARNEKKKKQGKKVGPVPPAVHKCIIAPLQHVFSDHTGPRAFVFNQIYEKDRNKSDRLEKLHLLANVIPLYRCHTGTCVSCGSTVDSLRKNNC